jgi:hypothetical protein
MAIPHRLSAFLESLTSSPAPQEAPGIDALAGAIRGAGMAGVASVLLHTTRPLAWVGGQMLWVLQPFADIFGGRRAPLSVSAIARMLEREGSVDDLLERLDTPARDRGTEL